MSTVAPQPLYCANHPNVETSLRCNNCEKPICPKCAVLTPTGYRCKECVRGQQKVFDTALWRDYPLAFIIAAILAFAGSYIASFVGFFTIFIAPIAGVVIAEIVRFVIRRRRSPRLFLTAAVGVVLGSLPLLLAGVFGLLFGGGYLGGLMSLVWHGIYTFIVTSSFYYRLRGISIR
jgi:B-box zinc finger